MVIESQEMKPLKTGTTTVVVKGKDCVVLAGDMRMTRGYEISEKNVEKVLIINDYIAMTIAGTVSTVQMVEKYLRSEIKMRELRTGRKPNVKEVASMVRTWLYHSIRGGGIFAGLAAFMLGGYDKYGPAAYNLGFDGTLYEIELFQSDGSGSSYALGMLESNYKKDLSDDEAVKLAANAVEAAYQRDIASGNGLNVVMINKDGAQKVLTKTVDTKAK